MAVCAKCGSSLPDGANVCPACGTPVGAAAPPAFSNVEMPAAAPAPPAYAPAEPYTAPPAAPYTPLPTAQYTAPAAYPPAAAAPPAKSGSSTLKIVLSIIGVIVLFGMMIAGYIAYKGYQVYQKLHSGGNSFSVGKSADIDESDLGVALYPGAVRNAAGGMKMKTSKMSIVSATYTTTDPAASVVDFYKDKMGADVNVRETVRSTTLTSSSGESGSKDALVVTVNPLPGGGSSLVIAHTNASTP
jgi:hypothetical protein